jgi:RNA polymerase sigma factor (sigma-70 family)
VVVNRSTSVLRRGMTELQVIPRLETGTTSVAPLEPVADAVWDSVRALPRRQAQTVARYYLEDLSIEQIADILECSAASVKTHLRRARERLGRKLQAWREEA